MTKKESKMDKLIGKLYPLNCKKIMQMGQVVALDIHASTGKVNAGMSVTNIAIDNMDLKEIAKFIKKELHYILSKKLHEEFIGRKESINGKDVIISILAPKDKNITIIHPENFREFVYGG